MPTVTPRFSPTDSIILLVDHQSTTIDWVKSLPKATVIASCRVLARMGVTFSIPLFLTTTMEEYVGPTIPDIQEVAPDAFAARFKRGGILSCFDQPELAAALKATGAPISSSPVSRQTSACSGPRAMPFASAITSTSSRTPAAPCPPLATTPPSTGSALLA